MSISEIATKLEAAGVEFTPWKNLRLYVKKTPNGSKGDYGYLVAGDTGKTGTCDNITKRKGEIAAILRGEK